ncbi:hypothetical protein HK102_004238 [Quaeritorhiza haematococci]|nr:hypothetical protein HK102_004238 [Quaeritorhiza haematococci]
MKFTTSIILAATALFASVPSGVEAHGKLVNPEGLNVQLQQGVPLNSQADVTRNRAGQPEAACGRFDNGRGQEMSLAGMDMTPRMMLTPGQTAQIEWFQQNGDGAGPLIAAIDPTGTDNSFQNVEVTQNIPGEAGRNRGCGNGRTSIHQEAQPIQRINPLSNFALSASQSTHSQPTMRAGILFVVVPFVVGLFAAACTTASALPDVKKYESKKHEKKDYHDEKYDEKYDEKHDEKDEKNEYYSEKYDEKKYSKEHEKKHNKKHWKKEYYHRKYETKECESKKYNDKHEKQYNNKHEKRGYYSEKYDDKHESYGKRYYYDEHKKKYDEKHEKKDYYGEKYDEKHEKKEYYGKKYYDEYKEKYDHVEKEQWQEKYYGEQEKKYDNEKKEYYGKYDDGKHQRKDYDGQKYGYDHNEQKYDGYYGKKH